MNKKKYSEILESVLKMQIDFIVSDPRYEDSEYLQGQETGLRIAIQKIKDSRFLTERGVNNYDNKRNDFGNNQYKTDKRTEVQECA